MPQVYNKRIEVLIIDDDELWSQKMKNLYAHIGAGAEAAYSGMEGMMAVFKHRPRLIFLDFVMGDFDGLELLKQCRDLPEYCQAVIMSAQLTVGIVHESVRLMADGILNKRCDGETLNFLLRYHLLCARQGRRTVRAAS